MQVAVVHDFARAADLAGPWQRLLERSCAGGIFQGPRFCLSFWKHFAGESVRPLLVVCREGDALLGVLPLYVARDGLVRPAQVMGDRLGAEAALLVDPAAGPAVVRALLGAVFEHVRCDALRLYGVREGPLLAWLIEAAEELGARRARRGMGAAHFVDLSGGYEAVVAGLSSRMKNTLRKKRKRAEARGGLVFTCHERFDPALFGEVLAVERASWKGEGAPRLNARRAFFEDVFRELGDAGALRVGALRQAGALAAYLICLRGPGGRVMAYETAYDRGLGDLSPGTLLHDAMLRALAAEGCREIDFLGGDEVYKADWTTRPPRPVFEVALFRPSFRGRMAAAYYRVKWAAKRRLAPRAASAKA